MNSFNPNPYQDSNILRQTPPQYLAQSNNSNQSQYNVQLSRNKFRIYNIFNQEQICTDDECNNSQDKVAAELYRAAKKVYKFFKEILDVNGIDGHGNVANFYINWQVDNAVWNCTTSYINKQCVFRFNNKYAVASEVVAHEYFHAIIHNKLNHVREPGALNESLADVFAIAFKNWEIDKDNIKSYWTMKTEKETSWSIGELRDISKSITIQEFQYLKTNEQLAKENDYGYVHDNSLIPSHAFYLATILSGNDIPKIAEIWFKASQELEFNETFASFALKTVKIAQTVNKQMQGIVGQAWVTVGVLNYTGTSQ